MDIEIVMENGGIIKAELYPASAPITVANFVKLMNFDLHGDPNAFWIALVVSLTLVGTIMMSKIVGSSLPLLAGKIGFDPAVMANPLITTVCDSLSLLIYFAIATNVLGL